MTIAPADCIYIAFSTDGNAIRFWTHDARVAEDWSADNEVAMAAYTAPLMANGHKTQAAGVPFRPETWPVDADGFASNMCTECGKPVCYGSRHTR